MPLITHGSDLTLAPTLRPLTPTGANAPRRGIQSVVDAGFHAVQLDATMPGLRPRELDASGRRDLSATLLRSGLVPTGVDFFIPQEHYRDAAFVDRAVESAIAAMKLAADLGRLPLSLSAPVLDCDPAVTQSLLSAADAMGIRLAVHHEAEPAALTNWLKQQDASVIGAGIDPAALLAARHDPVATLHACTEQLAVARLSDARRGQVDGSRCLLGRGDLDLMQYRVAVDLAPRRLGPVVLDLRMLEDPLAAAREAESAWQQAAMKL